MKGGILKVVHDRKTGEKLSEEIVEEMEINEDEYYAPLVRILGDSFLKEWNGGNLNAKQNTEI